MRKMCIRDRAGIDCYMSAGTIHALGLESHRLAYIRARQQFKIDTWTILPFEIEHDAAEPLGFLMANEEGEKLLYATDTAFVRYKFRGLTHIMIECNYADDVLEANIASGAIDPVLKHRLVRSHFSLEGVKEFLKANDLSQVKEVWLLHLSDGNSDAGRFKREIQELTGKEVYIADVYKRQILDGAFGKSFSIFSAILQEVNQTGLYIACL